MSLLFTSGLVDETPQTELKQPSAIGELLIVKIRTIEQKKMKRFRATASPIAIEIRRRIFDAGCQRANQRSSLNRLPILSFFFFFFLPFSLEKHVYLYWVDFYHFHKMA